jgi:hypothetical protein
MTAFLDGSATSVEAAIEAARAKHSVGVCENKDASAVAGSATAPAAAAAAAAPTAADTDQQPGDQAAQTQQQQQQHETFRSATAPAAAAAAAPAAADTDQQPGKGQAAQTQQQQQQVTFSSRILEVDEDEGSSSEILSGEEDDSSGQSSGQTKVNYKDTPLHKALLKDPQKVRRNLLLLLAPLLLSTV